MCVVVRQTQVYKVVRRRGAVLSTTRQVPMARKLRARVVAKESRVRSLPNCNVQAWVVSCQAQ